LRRTTFACRAANSWKDKESLWQEFLAGVRYALPSTPEPHARQLLALAGVPFGLRFEVRMLPRRGYFRGNDTLLKQTCYGFRCAWRVCWSGARVADPLLCGSRNVQGLPVLPKLVWYAYDWAS